MRRALIVSSFLLFPLFVFPNSSSKSVYKIDPLADGLIIIATSPGVMGGAVTPISAWGEDVEPKPISAGTSSFPAQGPAPNRDIAFRIGNESNQADGIFGPLTYGLRGQYHFHNNVGLEGGYILLHEPSTPMTSALLDEGQLKLRLPELEFQSQAVTLSATVWKNRLIDMYTSLFGLQSERAGALSVTFGFYRGDASFEDLRAGFTGIQAEVAGKIGSVTLALGNLKGWIENGGAYRKTALESTMELHSTAQVPINITLSLEDRFYSFGEGRPQSQASDELIFISGIEIHTSGLFQ